MSKPVWPTVVNHRSEHSGWGFKPMIDSIKSDFDAGPARTRRRFTSSRTEQTLSVVMTGSEFELFKTFVYGELEGASRWFLMPLFQGSVYAEYEVRFKDPQTPYEAVTSGFDRVTVSFTLETRKSLALYDAGQAYLLGLWGPEFTEEFCDALQIIVNESYPAIWQDNDY